MSHLVKTRNSAYRQRGGGGARVVMKEKPQQLSPVRSGDEDVAPRVAVQPVEHGRRGRLVGRPHGNRRYHGAVLCVRERVATDSP